MRTRMVLTMLLLPVLATMVVTGGAYAGGLTYQMDMTDQSLPVIYVDDDAGGTRNGSSWENAYTRLQDALQAAQPGDEIRVAQGVYRPSEGIAPPPVRARSTLSVSAAGGDRTASFQLKNGVAVRGGYAGLDHREPDTRDIGAYATILSGDLNADDGLRTGRTEDNSYHVVTASGTDATAVLEGVTITGGNANEENWDSDRSQGGGVYIHHGSPTLTHCTIAENSAVQGGGMCALSGSNPTLTDCRFIDNFATYHGGAMDNVESNPRLTNCVFLANAVERKYGGGMRNYKSSPYLVNCLFSNNVSVGNAAAMFNHNHSNPKIINCTFAYNAANGVGGIDNAMESTPGLTNCILWGNTSQDDDGEAAQIRHGPPTVEFCCIQGWTGALGGTGNHGHDPQFADPRGADGIIGTEDDDLRLLPGSPCIDAGTNAGLPPSVTVDLAGNPRIINGTVDMGAYECGGELLPALYYVDAAVGHDDNSGASHAEALATVRRAIEIAQNGDTILVYPGTYFGEVEFLGKAVTVQGVATDAGVPVLQHPGDFAVSFYRGEGPDSVLANVVIRNSFIGVFLAASSPTIRNVTVVENHCGIEAYAGSQPDIASSILWGNVESDLFGCTAHHSCIQHDVLGQDNTHSDPLFADPDVEDYHLLSERGRHWPRWDVWVLDEVTSPCIDGGDPNAPVGQERVPNGGRINMGAYGGTPYASMTPTPACDANAANQPPQVTILAPPDGISLYYQYGVGIFAEANDLDGYVVSVEFFANGEKIGQDLDGSDGWSMEWTEHSAGEYKVVARATDDGGAAADSTEVNVRLHSGASRSSRTYKTHIEDLAFDHGKVLKLRPVTFRWKATDHQDIGLIAEELAEQLPDLVIYDPEGKPDGVMYDKVALYLLAVVKEQQRRIEALEAPAMPPGSSPRRIQAAEEALQHTGRP